MKIIKTVIFSLRFFKTVEGGILQKISKTAKYYPRYYYHLTLQQTTIKYNYQQYLKVTKSKQQQNLKYYKTIMSKYFQIRQKIISKSKESVDQMKDQNIRQSLIKNLMKEGFQKMSLFYESLQNLVEGRREVLQNEEFIFDDGQSVRQKRQQFQKQIERFFGKKAPKSQEKNDEEQFQ